MFFSSLTEALPLSSRCSALTTTNLYKFILSDDTQVKYRATFIKEEHVKNLDKQKH